MKKTGSNLSKFHIRLQITVLLIRESGGNEKWSPHSWADCIYQVQQISFSFLLKVGQGLINKIAINNDFCSVTFLNATNSKAFIDFHLLVNFSLIYLIFRCDRNGCFNSIFNCSSVFIFFVPFFADIVVVIAFCINENVLK